MKKLLENFLEKKIENQSVRFEVISAKKAFSSQRIDATIIVPTIRNWEKLGIRVFYFFNIFLFSMQKQIPQIIIQMGRVIKSPVSPDSKENWKTFSVKSKC